MILLKKGDISLFKAQEPIVELSYRLAKSRELLEILTRELKAEESKNKKQICELIEFIRKKQRDIQRRSREEQNKVDIWVRDEINKIAVEAHNKKRMFKNRTSWREKKIELGAQIKQERIKKSAERQKFEIVKEAEKKERDLKSELARDPKTRKIAELKEAVSIQKEKIKRQKRYIEAITRIFKIPYKYRFPVKQKERSRIANDKDVVVLVDLLRTEERPLIISDLYEKWPDKSVDVRNVIRKAVNTGLVNKASEKIMGESGHLCLAYTLVKQNHQEEPSMNEPPKPKFFRYEIAERNRRDYEDIFNSLDYFWPMKRQDESKTTVITPRVTVLWNDRNGNLILQVNGKDFSEIKPDDMEGRERLRSWLIEEFDKKAEEYRNKESQSF